MMKMDNLFIVKQPLQMFLNKRINIKTMNMLDIMLEHGYFNKRLQHLMKTSISNSKAKMWHPRLWMALIMLSTR